MIKKAFVLLVLSFTICAFSNQRFNPEVQQELVLIENEHDFNLNPHTSNYSSESQLLNALYEGLFAYDPLTLEPIPAIAEDYGVSLDKKKWTFYIRPEATFSNGERITAHDVKNSWINVLNPELQAPFASLIDCIEGVAAYRLGYGDIEDVKIEAKNKSTLIVTLTSPTEYLPKVLTHHAFSIVPEEENVYSGPYTLQNFGKDEILFAKNENYYDAKNVAIPSIKVILSDDDEENTYMFNMGLAQWTAGGVDIDGIYDINSLYLSAQFCTEFLFFKSVEKPWDNENLRNAIIHALPFEQLRSLAFYPASTLVLPLGNYPNVIGAVEQDLEYSKELLEKEGYELIVNEDGSIEPIGLTLTYALPNTEYEKERALLISDSLAQIGIAVKFETTPIERYLSGIKGWDANIFSYTWAGDFADPLSFLELFRTGSSLKESEWSDAEYDKLLDEASVIEDSELRYEKLAEAEQYLIDAGVVIPIQYPVSFNVVDTAVLGGWFPNALNIHPFKDMYFIEQETSSDFI